MQAINHALTGALIGLAVGEPVIAAPAAVVSHFVCDAIPHFGVVNNVDKYLRSPAFRKMLYADATLCFILVAVLAAVQPAHWQLAAVCAFFAAAPDFLSFKRYVSALRQKKYNFRGYTRFARNIQWFERPIGAVVEAAWLAAGLILISPFLF
jgi:FlaA1/EpsC-like NDP-sugar epimerase